MLKETIKIEVDTSEVDALLEKLRECERLAESIEARNEGKLAALKGMEEQNIFYLIKEKDKLTSELTALETEICKRVVDRNYYKKILEDCGPLVDLKELEY